MLFVRHGQSEFNVVYGATGRDPGIEDPGLTELGRAQIAHTADALRPLGMTRIVSSPYRRALETAEILADCLSLEITVEPLVREHRHFVCDIGTTRSKLAESWPHIRFDHLDEQWWPEHFEQEEEVFERCRLFLGKLPAIPDWQDVICVSHWGFIKRLSGLPVQNGTAVRIGIDGRGKVVHVPDP